MPPDLQARPACRAGWCCCWCCHCQPPPPERKHLRKWHGLQCFRVTCLDNIPFSMTCSVAGWGRGRGGRKGLPEHAASKGLPDQRVQFFKSPAAQGPTRSLSLHAAQAQRGRGLVGCCLCAPQQSTKRQRIDWAVSVE